MRWAGFSTNRIVLGFKDVLGFNWVFSPNNARPINLRGRSPSRSARLCSSCRGDPSLASPARPLAQKSRRRSRFPRDLLQYRYMCAFSGPPPHLLRSFGGHRSNCLLQVTASPWSPIASVDVDKEEEEAGVEASLQHQDMAHQQPNLNAEASAKRQRGKRERSVDASSSNPSASASHKSLASKDFKVISLDGGFGPQIFGWVFKLQIPKYLTTRPEV